MFKIQANMDPAHRDRIAFLRICSGTYMPGMRLYHSRLGKEVRIGDAITFMAADRAARRGGVRRRHHRPAQPRNDQHRRYLLPGRGARVHGHSELRAGALSARQCSRTRSSSRRCRRGSAQLCEEGATQLFRPLLGNDMILGAVGPLQFEVASFRLRDEYGVQCEFEAVNVATARWVSCDDRAHLEEFTKKLTSNLASDHTGELVYFGTEQVELESQPRAMAEDPVRRDARARRGGVTACRSRSRRARDGNALTRARRSASARRSPSGS